METGCGILARSHQRSDIIGQAVVYTSSTLAILHLLLAGTLALIETMKDDLKENIKQ